MIFWILLALVIIATVWAFIWGLNDWAGGIGMGFLCAFGAAVLGAVIGGLLMLLLAIWFGPTAQFKGDSEHHLVALQTSSSVEGRFFLGSGYINGERTLNYITDDDGAFRIQSADADASIVYQDSENPTVTVFEFSFENPWFAPWSFGTTYTYEFHVPEGSILSDYTIDNG